MITQTQEIRLPSRSIVVSIRFGYTVTSHRFFFIYKTMGNIYVSLFRCIQVKCLPKKTQN